MLTNEQLSKSPCPWCGGIGLRHPDHPHAFGYKDTSRVTCRKRKKCGRTFDVDKYEAWLTKQPKKVSP